MDQKSDTGQTVCQRCGNRRALASVVTSSSRDALCGACLPAGLSARSKGVGALAAGLLEALLNHDGAERIIVPPIPTNYLPCRDCGLTFGEFSADGRAGCPTCYTAFLPAVRHAVEVLHSRA